MSDDFVARLRRYDQVGPKTIITEAADEIERLRAERDAARSEVCHLRPSVCLGAQTASEYAKQRGWDCFKEDGK